VAGLEIADEIPDQDDQDEEHKREQEPLEHQYLPSVGGCTGGFDERSSALDTSIHTSRTIVPSLSL